MRIAGAGGTGSVGKLVVERARAAGHDVVVISRSHGVDLTAGAGLDDALKNVATVIDVSNIRTVSKRAPIQFFETTTRNLLKAEQWCGVNHHVLPSIVGIDRVNWGYYQGKRRQEGLVLAGPVPATILRARVRGPHNFVVSVPWPSAAGWSMANGGLLPAGPGPRGTCSPINGWPRRRRSTPRGDGFSREPVGSSLLVAAAIRGRNLSPIRRAEIFQP